MHDHARPGAGQAVHHLVKDPVTGYVHRLAFSAISRAPTHGQQVGAADDIGERRGEEEDRSRHVLRSPLVPERRRGDQPVDLLPWDGRGAGGRDLAWGYDVAGAPGWLQFQREVARERHHRPFARP